MRDKYADCLNRKDLEKLRLNLKSCKRSNVTCNKYQAYIRAILSWAVNQEFLPFNLWRDFKRLPVKKRIVTANILQFKSIIKHSPERLQWAFYTAYACSLRFGEIELFNLTWDAFNFRQGYVQLYQGKSGNLKRVFPPAEYMQAAALRFEKDFKNGVPLVCHRHGRKVLSYRRAWLKALKDAGLEGMSIKPYDIRHVAATEMLSRGVDPATVAAQLGHSSPATTMNFYAHTSVGNQKLASKTLPNLCSEHE